MNKLSFGAAAICAFVLAACTIGEQPKPNAQQPTAIVASQPTTAARPTSAAQPTQGASQPTAQPGKPAPQPTTQVTDAQPVPVIGFNPQAGGPGTQIAVFGSGMLANQMVKVRLGLPQAIGEVLASATADHDGRWSARFTMPDRLPSGDLITGENMRLVAMNERDEAVASAPWSFTPAPADVPPAAASATDMVGNFLNAVIADTTGETALQYLSTDLRGAVERGEYDIHSLLGEQNPLRGFTIDSFTENQSPSMPYPVVQATLAYGQPPQPASIRQFSLTQEQGQWRIGAVAAVER